MATMKDVAAMAGVSFTTVSHVVNRTRPVSDAVRKKVEDAIAQLHYVPSAVARSLKVRTTSIIGLLVVGWWSYWRMPKEGRNGWRPWGTKGCSI